MWGKKIKKFTIRYIVKKIKPMYENVKSAVTTAY